MIILPNWQVLFYENALTHRDSLGLVITPGLMKCAQLILLVITQWSTFDHNYVLN